MLDERLQTLFDLCPPCDCVADIGTDHGYLPLELLRRGKCSRAIACDVSAPSLQKAIRLSHARGVFLDCRCGDGLDPLGREEADCIILAGMGGILISELLLRGREKIGGATLVLQPMTAVRELREALIGGGFVITAETMIFQGRHRYHFLTAKIGEAGDYDCEIGSLLRGHPQFLRYLAERRQTEEQTLQKMGAFRGEEYERHAALLQTLHREETLCRQSHRSEN